MKLKTVLSVLFFIAFIALCNAQNGNKLTLKVNNRTYWWTGVISQGWLMPIKSGYNVDMNGDNYNNQIQPLLLSNQGEVIWCNQPISIKYRNDSLIVESKTGRIDYNKPGTTLKQAYEFATKKYFPFTGKTPNNLFFSKPQYNTWIELMYNQNETDILKYAKSIVKNKLPHGVLIIDDNWQEDYGNWTFNCCHFKSPKKMISDLHKMGFKVMLWVSPFVSPDSEIGREVVKKHLVLLNKENKPFICHWWNGYSLLLDFSNPDAVKWFKNSLNILLTRYGVDGFKFDGGDAQEYAGDIIPFKNGITANTETELYAKIGLDYPFNEYRANWKMGGEALTNRLADKGHNWEDLRTLIPDMILEGLMGYPYSCPDMIGGGEFTSFLDAKTIDQNLIVRSAQCSALMPMMQFSVAPWRILDRMHFDAVLKAVKLREKFVGYILRTVKHTAVTGDPILRNMEYEFPHCGYEKIKDQFLIGDSLLVAPILQNNISKREIILPKGRWKYESGSVYEGPKTVEVDAGLDVLPYFIKLK